jgi:hypothetical protein
VAVPSLKRLPVVDPTGEVFAYVLAFDGGSDQDVAGSGLAVLMTDVAGADLHRAYVAAGVSGSSGPNTVLADELRPRGLCTDRVNTQRLVALLAEAPSSG